MRILRSRRYSTYFGCETKTDSIFIRPLWRISCQYDTFCDCRRPLVEYVIIYCLGCRPQAEPIHIYWLRLWPIQIDANVNDITQFCLDAATNIVIAMILIFIYVFSTSTTVLTRGIEQIRIQKRLKYFFFQSTILLEFYC